MCAGEINLRERCRRYWKRESEKIRQRKLRVMRENKERERESYQRQRRDSQLEDGNERERGIGDVVDCKSTRTSSLLSLNQRRTAEPPHHSIYIHHDIKQTIEQPASTSAIHTAGSTQASSFLVVSMETDKQHLWSRTTTQSMVLAVYNIYYNNMVYILLYISIDNYIRSSFSFTIYSIYKCGIFNDIKIYC